MTKQITLITVILVNIATGSQILAMTDIEWQEREQKLKLVESSDSLRFGEINNNVIAPEKRAEFERIMGSRGVYISSWDYVSSRNLLAQVIVETRNPQLKDSILVEAVNQRDYYLAKHALEHGANPNTTLCNVHPNIAYTGYPIIFQAESINIVKTLVQHGASLPRAQSGVNSLLHQACDSKYDWQILQYCLTGLISDINHKSCRNTTPLHYWAFRSLETAEDSEDNILSALEKLRLLLKAGANPTLKDSDGRTALDLLKSQIKNKKNTNTKSETIVNKYSKLIETLETATQNQPSNFSDSLSRILMNLDA